MDLNSFTDQELAGCITDHDDRIVLFINNLDDMTGTIARLIGNLYVGSEELLNGDIHVSVYPNPVGESARLTLSLDDDDQISIWITDVKGRKCADLAIERQMKKGEHQIVLDFSSLEANAVYLINIRSSIGSHSIRIIK